MKNLFKNVIERGGYDLTALLKNIDNYHIEGRLSDADRKELYDLARHSAEAQFDVKTEITMLWAVIRDLQAAIRELQAKQDAGDEEIPDVPVEEWPEYVQPTGAHDAYQIGDPITFWGEKYRCKMANCVWSPEIMPDAWEKAKEEVESEPEIEPESDPDAE